MCLALISFIFKVEPLAGIFRSGAQLLFIYLKRILSGSDLYMSEYKSSTWDYYIWGVSDFMEVAILKCSSYDPFAARYE